MTITEETCGCGATFTITCRYLSDARRAAAEWRETHQHPAAVEPGPCSAEFPHPLVWPGQFTLTPSCQLRAGHAGDHESGETRWGKTNEGDA